MLFINIVAVRDNNPNLLSQKRKKIILVSSHNRKFQYTKSLGDKIELLKNVFSNHFKNSFEKNSILIKISRLTIFMYIFCSIYKNELSLIFLTESINDALILVIFWNFLPLTVCCYAFSNHHYYALKKNFFFLFPTIVFLVDEIIPRSGLVNGNFIDLIFYFLIVILFRSENSLFFSSPIGSFSKNDKEGKKQTITLVFFGFLIFIGIKWTLIIIANCLNEISFLKNVLLASSVETIGFLPEICKKIFLGINIINIKDLLVLLGFLTLIYNLAFKESGLKYRKKNSDKNGYTRIFLSDNLEKTNFGSYNSSERRNSLLSQNKIQNSNLANQPEIMSNLFGTKLGPIPKKSWSIRRNCIKTPVQGILWNHPTSFKKGGDFHRLKKK